MSGEVGRAARVLGFAGLLPQIAAVSVLATLPARHGIGRDLAAAFAGGAALIYAVVILSFLGGIWWGFAMRRERGQAVLAGVAVLPSLIGVGTVLVAVPGDYQRPPLLAIGVALIATLAVDRHLVATGEAPAGWMGLRVPLSLGLGVLTIAAGALVGG